MEANTEINISDASSPDKYEVYIETGTNWNSMVQLLNAVKDSSACLTRLHIAVDSSELPTV